MVSTRSRPGLGNDVLDGGQGEDVLRGWEGNDRLQGKGGSDILAGGAGNDILIGSSGDDTLDGGQDFDVLLGGDGADVLTGGDGDDWLLGGSGADVTRSGPQDDLIVLRAGDVGSDENELIDGGEGHDILTLNGFIQSELPELPAAPAGADASSAPAAPEFVLSDPLTGGRYHLFGVEQIQHTHLFTHLGTSENLRASFLFINPSAGRRRRGARRVFRQ